MVGVPSSILGVPTKDGQQVAGRLEVTEGIAGYWHYHLSGPESPYRGLCGAKVMHTAIRLQDWGVPFGEHFPKRPTWCDKCEALRSAVSP
jgi:hypothetical protein